MAAGDAWLTVVGTAADSPVCRPKPDRGPDPRARPAVVTSESEVIATAEAGRGESVHGRSSPGAAVRRGESERNPTPSSQLAYPSDRLRRPTWRVATRTRRSCACTAWHASLPVPTAAIATTVPTACGRCTSTTVPVTEPVPVVP